MRLFKLHTLCLLGYIAGNGTFPTSVGQFHRALHERLTPDRNTESDACRAIGNEYVVQYQEAIDCYNSFPLSASVRQDTLENLKKILEIYVFKDIMTQSPDENIPSSRDIDAELKEITNYEFNSEFEFNSFLNGYFNTFYDGHTSYRSDCYSSFIFRQPFPIYILGNKVKILDEIIHQEFLIEIWSRLGIEVIKYKGSEVLKINDMEPLEFLKLYSKFYIGWSSNINFRLNFGFARTVLNGNNKWEVHQGAFAHTTLVPLKPSVSYSLKTPDGKIHELDVPYLAESPGLFNNYSTFYSKFCKLDEKRRSKRELGNQALFQLRDDSANQPLKKRRRSKKEVDLQLIFRGPGITAYLMGDKTGVLVVTSFSEGADEDWNTGINNIIDSFNQNSVENVILELSDNFWGLPCRVFKLLKSFIKDFKQFPLDIRNSYLQEALSQLKYDRNGSIYNPFSPKNYVKEDGSEFESEDAFNELKHYNRGLVNTATFTPKFIFDCPADSSSLSFKLKNIAISSNAVCFSACAFTVKSFQQLTKVPTYVYGGDPTIPTQPGSGLDSIANFETIYSLASNSSNDKLSHYLKPLPHKIRLTIGHCEAYSLNHPNRPLEYIFLPADFHLPYNEDTFYHPKYKWDYIMSQMINNSSSYHQSKTRGNP